MKIDSFIKKFSFLNNFNNYPDAVIVIDYLNNIAYWNKKACEIFGYTEKEMIGRNIALLFDSEAEKIYTSIETEKSFVISSKNSLDEDIFVEISCKDLTKKEKILITARDVTKNQKVIEKLLVEYESASKISLNKGNFICSLSGDLKTPIHSFIGFSQGLLDGICGELNEKQTRYVTIINKNANNLLELVDNVLDLSRMEIGNIDLNLKVFNMAKAINTVSDKIRPRAEQKGLRFEIDINDEVKKNIFSSEKMLSQVIFNVLDNAVKFTEIGSVRLKVMHPDIDLIKNQGIKITEEFNDNSYLLFNITDTGIGIPKEETPAIFDEYSQTERNIAKKYGGTGLNLALCRKILAHLGGAIWVESEPGQGSSFSFMIPVERPVQKVDMENIEDAQAV